MSVAVSIRYPKPSVCIVISNGTEVAPSTEVGGTIPSEPMIQTSASSPVLDRTTTEQIPDSRK
ncbi:hypothetical protein D3C71_1007070 [compost metagenome]